jgi:hypothetical protein
MNKFDVLGKTFWYTKLEDGTTEVLDEDGVLVCDQYISDLIHEENESVEYYETMGDWY